MRQPKKFPLSWRDLIVWLSVVLVLAGLYSLRQDNSGLRYTWNWAQVGQFFFFRDGGDQSLHMGPLLKGLLSTIKLAAYSIVLALLFGIPMGILQVQPLRLFRLIGQFYVELIRNIPPLVVVMIFYFFFASPLVDWLELESLSRNASPQLRRLLGFLFDMGNTGKMGNSGQNNLILGNFFAATIILGIYEGSYIAEIVRAGLQTIPRAQQQAAISLGFTSQQSYRLVLLPQMFRAELPALTNQFVSAIKDSAIVSLISIQELTFRSKQVITTTRAFVESSIALFLIYLLLTGLFSFFSARLVEHYKLR